MYFRIYLLFKCVQLASNITTSPSDQKFMMTQKNNCSFNVPAFPQNFNLHGKQEFYSMIKTAKGTDLFSRYYPAIEYVRKAEQDGLWFEKRKLVGPPLTQIIVEDIPTGRQIKGLNFATNNYLGLANHPITIQMGTQAGQEFGVNSAGSPLAFGATKYYSQLRQQIGQYLGSNCLIFSSAWLAYFGFIKSIVKDYDHILLDESCDLALFEGANYTTKSVHTFKHLDTKDMQQKLIKLRREKENGILVVTDCLFAQDSSSPDLKEYQRITSENQSYLVLNIGHDFGAMGNEGKGVWEEQGLTELQNVFFLGSASKTLGVNFGFIALPGAKGNVTHFFKYFCSTYMFTNAINPIQCNSGLAALRMARSEHGRRLRVDVLENSKYLREKLSQVGLEALGRASPFVCVKVGPEVLGRIVLKIMSENGVFVNFVEYPHAKIGESTIRMTLTPDHTREQIDRLVDVLSRSLEAGKVVFDREVERQRLSQSPKL